MSGFRVAEVCRYQFRVPESWALQPLPSDGALHAVLAIPGASAAEHVERPDAAPPPAASVQLEVAAGVGSLEVFEQYLLMHRTSASAAAETPGDAGAASREGRGELSLELQGAEGTIHRRVHAALVANDLVSVVLTWREGAEDLGALQRAAAQALESALPRVSNEAPRAEPQGHGG